jgi:hypothetical protein
MIPLPPTKPPREKIKKFVERRTALFKEAEAMACKKKQIVGGSGCRRKGN